MISPSPPPSTLPARPRYPLLDEQLSQLADFIVKRNILFEVLKEKHEEILAYRPRTPITVTLMSLPGTASKVPATARETTAGHLLKNIGRTVAAEAVVAKVDGSLWDLNRPF